MQQVQEKILVVDDEKVIRDLASMVLSTRGHNVRIASSGENALELVEEFSPALILLDYMMPEMNGMQALKLIREQHPDAYVVMFTGKGSEEIAVESMKAGASDYIRKPFNNQDLLDRIENVLRIRRIEIRNRELLDERERLLEEIAGWNCELERRVEEKSLELEQAQAGIIQAEKLGALGHLAAGMAHEIRNPLNSINLFSQVLKQGIEFNPEMAGYTDKIQSEVDRIDSILIKLLSVTEKSQVDISDISLTAVLDQVVNSFRQQLALQNVELVTTFANDVPVIKANNSEIEQIFTNLVSNALHEMPDGGQLILSLCFDARNIYIQVADTGKGIPREHLHRIFDPFFTTRKRGTGFGLSAVLRTIKSYDGRIVAGNRSGGGAVFDIELPIF